MVTNRRIVLNRRPVGMPVPEDFGVQVVDRGQLADGQILVENHILSIDPAIRGWLDDRPSYMPPIGLGEVIRGMTLGEVIESRNPAIPVGSMVRGLAAWEEYSVLGDALGLEILAVDAGVPAAQHMGVLGPAGLTAWIGLKVIGDVKPGETVLISAAAGAVGNVAGQIAKILGCRVVGIAGTEAKCQALLDIGFDAVVNHRTATDLEAAIREACPEGIDVYFDNVGGRVLEAVLPVMRLNGRVAVCGMVGDYNDAGNPYGVKTLWQLVVNRITMRGFLTYDHADRLGEAQADLDRWVRAGTLLPIDNVRHGIDSAPLALIDLLAGRTHGKTLVHLKS